jgi:electron transport complex protein RnfC
MPPVAPADASILRRVETPARLRIPLATHALTESSPLVRVGLAAVVGERLTDTLAEAGPAVLAPTSGRVVGQSAVTLTNGQAVPAVELECDFQDRAPDEAHDAITAEMYRQRLDAVEKAGSADLGQWIDRLRFAGVWADRRHSPDLLGQLHQTLRRPVDTILCNLVDHDGSLRLQSTLAQRFGPVLLEGVALLARITSARNIWIAVEAGTPHRWWLPLRREMRDAGVDVVPVLADYPQADPTLLIYTLLRRRLRPGRSPVEQGVLLLDGAAAIAVGRAAGREQPMLQTPLAIRDHINGKSHFVVAPIGVSLRHVISELALPMINTTLLRGDVLRDEPITPDAIVSGGEISFHLIASRPPAVPEPCIRCGWCAEVCPTRVQPAGVLEASQRRNIDLADHYGLDACIECGICSFACPSHLPLLQGIRAIKQNRHASDDFASQP